jgi:hypothetical protein
MNAHRVVQLLAPIGVAVVLGPLIAIIAFFLFGIVSQLRLAAI